MVRAIGADIVDLDRFAAAVDRWGDHFLRRILTAEEIAYCRRKTPGIDSMAARFAAKEAFIKCLSEVEYRHFRWHDIQVENAPNGRPELKLHGGLAALFARQQILLTLSHSRLAAVAVVVIQEQPAGA
ncbi:MAG TPA: holo-ACP synthase [bacterium]|nr:holo-ACP synthase [bacterium]HPR88771.1 holo-ACP synthase [bacterium]